MDINVALQQMRDLANAAARVAEEIGEEEYGTDGSDGSAPASLLAALAEKWGGIDQFLSRSGFVPADWARSAPPAKAKVFDNLTLRTYPAEAGDRTDYVVLDIHGVSIGVKLREHDLYVHIDPDEAVQPAGPVVVEVNGLPYNGE